MITTNTQVRQLHIMHKFKHPGISSIRNATQYK